MDLLHHKIDEQVQMGHDIVLFLYDISGLPKLWLPPMAVIPQVGRLSRLIFYLTWRGLNKSTTGKPPEEVMSFGGILHCITNRFLKTDPRLGPVYLGKVDLAATYVWLWVLSVVHAGYFCTSHPYTYNLLS